MTDYNIPVKKQGLAIEIDTTLTSNDVMFIDEMSGGLGDAGRKIYLAIKERPLSNNPKDEHIPMNMAGRDIRLKARDADGFFKQVSTATKITDTKAGLVEMVLPRELYQAVGKYQAAKFEIFETDGDTVISTVNVGFEVYDSLVHMSVGENKLYIDEADKLIKDLEKMTGNALDEFRDKLNKMNGDVTGSLEAINGLSALVEVWKQMVKDNSVAIKSDDNIMTGFNKFTEFITGFTTGNTIKSFGATDPAQDIDNLNVLREMRPATTKYEYFVSNKAVNNPTRGDNFYLVTEKVSEGAVFQHATRIEDSGYGVVKMRRIYGLDSTPVVGSWYAVSEWGSTWWPLEPYLTNDFTVGAVAPMYKIVKDEVRIRGSVRAKKTLENKAADSETWQIFKNLPFEFLPGQGVLQVGTGANIFTLFASGTGMTIQKYQRGGEWRDAPAGGYLGVGGHYDIRIKED